jgi:hypothetical protein
MAQYTYTEIDLRPFRCGPTRTAIRKRLFLNFANENPGTGKQKLTSRYRYIVETLSDGTGISIFRPGRRNGTDFRIEVEGYKFRNKTHSPKYEDIYEDLLEKKRKDEKLYQKLVTYIDAVYNCEDVKDKQIQALIQKYDGTGYPVDLVLWVIKWFLIEQDVLNWNISGRNCDFYNRIPR